MVVPGFHADALQNRSNIWEAGAATQDIEYKTSKSVFMHGQPRTMQRSQFRINFLNGIGWIMWTASLTSVI